MSQVLAVFPHNGFLRGFDNSNPFLFFTTRMCHARYGIEEVSRWALNDYLSPKNTNTIKMNIAVMSKDLKEKWGIWQCRSRSFFLGILVHVPGPGL